MLGERSPLKHPELEPGWTGSEKWKQNVIAFRTAIKFCVEDWAD